MGRKTIEFRTNNQPSRRRSANNNRGNFKIRRLPRNISEKEQDNTIINEVSPLSSQNAFDRNDKTVISEEENICTYQGNQ